MGWVDDVVPRQPGVTPDYSTVGKQLRMDPPDKNAPSSTTPNWLVAENFERH